MFYCDPCATKKNWPNTGFQSYGKCEVCGVTRGCNDMPSKDLPVRIEESAPFAVSTPVVLPPEPEHHQTTMAECPSQGCESTLPSLEIDVVTGRGLCLACGYRMTPEDLQAMNLGIAPNIPTKETQ